MKHGDNKKSTLAKAFFYIVFSIIFLSWYFCEVTFEMHSLTGIVNSHALLFVSGVFGYVVFHIFIQMYERGSDGHYNRYRASLAMWLISLILGVSLLVLASGVCVHFSSSEREGIMIFSGILGAINVYSALDTRIFSAKY